MVVKPEEFFCLKCGELVKLFYLPNIDRVTEDFFKEIQEACLCAYCFRGYSSSVKPKTYLH